MEIDVWVDGIPEEICRLVKYVKPSQDLPLCFCIELAQGPKFKPYLLSLKKYYPDLHMGPTQDQQGFCFGSLNKQDNDAIAELFDVSGYGGRTSELEAQEAPAKFYTEYPWHKMKEVGDHFVVDGEPPSHVAVAAHRRSEQTGQRFLTKSLVKGANYTIVVMIDKPNHQHTNIVRLRKD